MSAVLDKSHLGFLSSGFATLIVVAFIDNVRGPILPVLCQSLQIPYEIAGLFLTVGCVTAVLATWLLGIALRHWGERELTVAICLISTLPGWFAPQVASAHELLGLGVLLGSAIALLGSICSILTIIGSPQEARGRYVAFQHVMYGLGSMAAPLLFAALFEAQKPWWWLLRATSWMLLGLAAYCAKVLPKGRKPERQATPHPLPHLRIMGPKLLMFASYVAGEVLVSMWMTSLLVSEQHKTPAEASQYLSLFFIILALSRFSCFLFVRQSWEKPVLLASLALAIISSILGQQGYSWALPAIGLLGPFYPLSMARVSLQFPATWKQMTLIIYATIQSTLALMHMTVGNLADHFSMKIAFLLPPFFLGLAWVILSRELSTRSQRTV